MNVPLCAQRGISAIALAVSAGIAAGGDAPPVQFQSIAITLGGDLFIAGGPLSGSDSFSMPGDQPDVDYADGRLVKVGNCAGCPNGELGQGSASAGGGVASPVLLADLVTWEFTMSLSSAGSADAVQYNSGPPTFSTSPTNASVSSNAGIVLDLTLTRRALLRFSDFSASASANKVLTAGTATASANIELADSSSTTLVSASASVSATQQGSSPSDSESGQSSSLVLEAGDYVLSASADALSGGIAITNSSMSLSGESVALASIRVTPCPQIIEQPQSLAVPLGHIAEIQARIDAWAPGTGGRWTWRRDGQPLNGTEPGIFILFPTLPTSIVFIPALDASHVGTYDATWTGTCGSITSDGATLSIAACQPDLNSDNELDFNDLVLFLSAFDAQEAPGDWSDDGTYDFFDVIAYVAAFDAGCP